jgi:hypothetical protein
MAQLVALFSAEEVVPCSTQGRPFLVYTQQTNQNHMILNNCKPLSSSVCVVFGRFEFSIAGVVQSG